MILLLLLGMVLGATAPLTLDARPRFSLRTPATVTLVMRIAPHAANTGLDVAVDSETYMRSSHFDLNGEDSPRIETLSYDRLPPGYYHAAAALTRNDRSHPAPATATFCVGGGEISCADSR